MLRQIIAHDLDTGMHDIAFPGDFTPIWIHDKNLSLPELQSAITFCLENGWLEKGGGGLRLTAPMFN